MSDITTMQQATVAPQIEMQALSQVTAVQSSQAIAQGVTSTSSNPSGTAISEAFESQINGLDVANRNVADSIGMLNVADGSLGVINESLQRIRELTVQATSPAYNDGDRKRIGMEIKQLLEGVNDIAKNTQFNKKNLLDGSLGKDNGGVNVQTGANANQQSNFSIESSTVDALGLTSLLEADYSKAGYDEFQKMLKSVDTALDTVSTSRATIGAKTNALSYNESFNDTTRINMSASKSRITDTNYAKEVLKMNRQSIRQNADLLLMSQNIPNMYKVADLVA